MNDFSNEQRSAVRDLVDREVRRSGRGGSFTGFLMVLAMIGAVSVAGFWVWKNDDLFDDDGGGGGDGYAALLVQSLLDQIGEINGELRHIGGTVARLRADYDELDEQAERSRRTWRELERQSAELEAMTAVAERLNVRLNAQANELAQSETLQNALAERLSAQTFQSGVFECGHTYRPTGDTWETVLVRTVEFDQEFGNAPTVFLSLTKVELYGREPNSVYSVRSDNVGTNTFDIVVEAAHSSSFSDCRIEWIAVSS